MNLLHRFKSDISVVEAPRRFNNPFYYQPHALCMLAADEVRSLLLQSKDVADDAARGKMLGVLVVRDGGGALGYLAAFSGLLAGNNNIPGFVPPVFDLQSPNGYFKQEEAEISALNTKIKDFECSREYGDAIAAVGALRSAMEKEISAMREDMRCRKRQRDAARATAMLSAAEEAALVRESQFLKAELKRVTAKWQQKIAECESVSAPS